MIKRIFVYIQYALPQHLLTNLIGWLAEIRISWLKNFLIQQFIHLYKVDMQEAAQENPISYPDFNTFFIRELKSALRPVAAGVREIACPADGKVAQIGCINKSQLLQAKNMYFSLETLLGGETALAQTYVDGAFATIYLAPYNYHRFHMPITGKLVKTIFVPGRLFSVNAMTSALIPNLYGRNERLIAIFDTAAGSMAVIMVGAMLVGSIKTVWMDKPIRHRRIVTESFSHGVELQKGAELGYFKMGSTVILLFEKNKIEWATSVQANSLVKFGQQLGNIS